MGATRSRLGHYLEEYSVPVSAIHTIGTGVQYLQYTYPQVRKYSLFQCRPSSLFSFLRAGRLYISKAMDTSAAKREFKLRRVEGIVRNFVARHAGHKTDAQKRTHARMIPLDQHHWTEIRGGSISPRPKVEMQTNCPSFLQVDYTKRACLLAKRSD